MRKRYEQFKILDLAEKARHYLTSMVDEACDYLPYWFIQINSVPAYAKHVRVDDAELVASWYEAIVSVRKILGSEPLSAEVEAGFRRHLMRSWGPAGLRYHEDYEWSNTNHSSFHEMAYILSALNRILLEYPEDKEAECRASDLVRGMRGLVIERTTKTFWSGDFPFDEKVYEFPYDVYLRDGGWVPERCTGRGEESIRNGMMLHALAVRADSFKDEVALDLATGMANHLLGLSRYFNWKGEFFGHVHSAVWVASGLARLGRISGNEHYVESAYKIYQYVKSLSSEFGWVPEYAQWHPMQEEHCETCCIKDMIECSFELIDCGYDCWDLVNKFVRNQLSEQQIKDGSFVVCDEKLEDTPQFTYRAIDKRVVGGWSGGAEPNSISVSRFRSIAGCCVGTAPQALFLVYDRIIRRVADRIYVNLPIDKEDEIARLETGYPNAGEMKVTAKESGDYLIRKYDWMGEMLETAVNGEIIAPAFSDGCLLFRGIESGDVITLSHRLDTCIKSERVKDFDYTVSWRGPDVVQLDPPGLPLRLYQRELGIEKELPVLLSGSAGELSMAPTQQKR